MKIKDLTLLTATILLAYLFNTGCAKNEPNNTNSHLIKNQTGSLSTFIDSVELAPADSGLWVAPNDSRQQQFSDALTYLFATNTEKAAEIALQAGYDIIKLQNTDTSNADTLYLLTEQQMVNEAGYTGGGIVVYRASGSDLAIEVPHPIFDSFTLIQGIESFNQSNAKLLLIAGTHRHAALESTLCSGTSDYRSSDVAHSNNNLFHTAHRTANNTFPELTFIQLHGFGSSSLQALQQTTSSTDEAVVIISQGVNSTWDTTENHLAAKLKRALDLDDNISALIYPNDYDKLGGTRNTQGRLSNGSSEPCLSAANSASGRFVHLEQSYTVRNLMRSNISDAIISAINN